MKHECGLDQLSEKISFKDCNTEEIKKNVVGKIIEETTPFLEPDCPRTYHALTRDLITNEIFRRVEP